MNEVTIGILGLVIVLILFMTGIELAFAMTLIGFLGFSYLVTFKAGMNILAKDFIDVFANYGFTVIPLFVLMGQIAFNAGIAKRLYDSAYRFIGHIPGGLAMATVVGATIFKAICGSSPATAATFASVAVPEMDRYNYAKKLSTGIVATVGTLGILIPPSVTLIVFGIITEQSIGKLFMAGLIPGLLIAFFFIFIIYGWCKINPTLGPKGELSSWKLRFRSIPDVIWVIIIFLLVISGLMAGFFTPTEAGSIGTAAVILLSVLRRDIGIKGYIKSVAESLRTACMVLLLIAGSQVLGHFLARTKIPMLAADWIISLPFAPWIIMILIGLVYLIGGSFIDDLAFMVLATPIFYPVIAKLGYDPLWFAIIIMITVMIGVVVPPMAINVFVVRNITKQPFSVIYSGVYPFLLSMVVTAALLFVFPQIATFLPNTMIGTGDTMMGRVFTMALPWLLGGLIVCALSSFVLAFVLRKVSQWIAKMDIAYKDAYGTILVASLFSIPFSFLYDFILQNNLVQSDILIVMIAVCSFLILFLIQAVVLRAGIETTFGKACKINIVTGVIGSLALYVMALVFYMMLRFF